MSQSIFERAQPLLELVIVAGPLVLYSYSTLSFEATALVYLALLTIRMGDLE